MEKAMNMAEVHLSVEEFDDLTKEHEFSEKYQRNKRKMLRQYKRRAFWAGQKKMLKAAAAVVFLMAAMPILAAASGSDLFYRLWGTAGKENIPSHEEKLYGEEKDSVCIVTYPEREYTDTNLDRAEELLGNAISCEPVVKEIGDTKLTILASVCDGNAAVVEFTLEREGGIDFFQYGQLDNESKGAWFSEDAPFYFYFADCGESIYVDLEKSAGDILYCYDYMAVKNPGVSKGLTLEICWRTGTDAEGNMEEGMDKDTLFIPLGSELERKTFVNRAEGNIDISSIAMKADMSTGLGLSQEEACDPWNAYYVAVNYKNGSSYIVHEHGIEGVHVCENDIDNNGYACGDEEGGLVFVFNRLVDTDEIESVTVNDTIYMMQ